MYHVRICVIVRSRRQRLVDRVHRAHRRRCAHQVCIASRRSREMQDLRAAFPASPIVAYKYRIHCIRYFKASPLSRHLIAILRNFKRDLSPWNLYGGNYRMNKAAVPLYEIWIYGEIETEIVTKRAWYYGLNSRYSVNLIKVRCAFN